MLNRYLDGECPLSDSLEIRNHLTCCTGCSAALEEMRQLDRMLGYWEPEPVPKDFWDSVMTEVAGRSAAPGLHHRRRTGPGWFVLTAFGRQQGLILRDLAAAAAITMIIFWNAGAWLDEGKMTAAGKNVNGAVAAYTRIADTALELVTDTAGEITSKIYFEEWKQK